LFTPPVQAGRCAILTLEIASFILARFIPIRRPALRVGATSRPFGFRRIPLVSTPKASQPGERYSNGSVIGGVHDPIIRAEQSLCQ